jgi:hypothetical protein
VIRAASLAAVVLVLAAAVPQRVGAQLPVTPSISPEVRADVILGHQPAVQLGGGVQIPIGYYARLGIDGAVGVGTGHVTSLSASGPDLDGRLDLLVRFLLDPFRQTPYGLSLGGGMSLRAEPRDRMRPVLLVAVDVEGRRSTNGWVPALQVGLGGGVRLGVVLRRGAAGGR